MPDWSPIPFDSVANGLWYLVLALLAAVGMNKGFKKADPPQEPRTGSVEVAGALIDSKSINLLVEALGIAAAALTDHKRHMTTLSAIVEDLAKLVEELTKTIDKSTDHGADVLDVARRLGRDIQDLRDTINRMPR